MTDHEHNVALAKMGAATSGAVIYSLTLQEWVAVVTIIFVVLQIGLLLPKYWAQYIKPLSKCIKRHWTCFRSRFK